MRTNLQDSIPIPTNTYISKNVDMDSHTMGRLSHAGLFFCVLWAGVVIFSTVAACWNRLGASNDPAAHPVTSGSPGEGQRGCEPRDRCAHADPRASSVVCSYGYPRRMPGSCLQTPRLHWSGCASHCPGEPGVQLRCP